jgi:hypothetical protein
MQLVFDPGYHFGHRSISGTFQFNMSVNRSETLTLKLCYLKYCFLPSVFKDVMNVIKMYVQIKQLVQCILSLNIMFVIILLYMLLPASSSSMMDWKLMLVV